jgi:uncharacterized protein
MGHCDSSAQLGHHSGIFDAVDRPAESAAAQSGDSSERRELTPASARSENSFAASILLLLVRLYIVFLSPILGGACKFHPSCSNYGREAISRYGARRGVVLTLKRLGRCRPFTKGGFDPVPDLDEFNTNDGGFRAKEGVQ